VGGSFRTTPAGRTDGGVGNGPVGRVGSNREQGEHGFRRGSGRSFSTPRFRTVSENGDGVEEAPARRGSEDDGALVRMKEHQELKNLLRAYQSSFLASYGRRPQFVRDWKPVWEQYQRYQTLRMELSDGRGVELNGGEAAKAAFV